MDQPRLIVASEYPTAVDPQLLLVVLVGAGLDVEQARQLTQPDGAHLAYRISAMLDQEPPALGLVDFSLAIHRVASRCRASYLLVDAADGQVAVGHLALGPVGDGNASTWLLRAYSQRKVLAFSDRASLTRCESEIFTELARPPRVRAAAVEGRAKAQLGLSMRLWTLAPMAPENFRYRA